MTRNNKNASAIKILQIGLWKIKTKALKTQIILIENKRNIIDFQLNIDGMDNGLKYLEVILDKGLT